MEDKKIEIKKEQAEAEVVKKEQPVQNKMSDTVDNSGMFGDVKIPQKFIDAVIKKRTVLDKAIYYGVLPLCCLIIFGSGSSIIAHTTYNGNAIDLVVGIVAFILFLMVFALIVDGYNRYKRAKKGNTSKIADVLNTKEFKALDEPSKKLLKDIL